MKIEKGYGSFSMTWENDKIRVIQIKKDFVTEFCDLFVTEDSGMYAKEIQEKLDNIRDFAVGMLAELIKKRAYKNELLTKNEHISRFK